MTIQSNYIRYTLGLIMSLILGSNIAVGQQASTSPNAVEDIYNQFIGLNKLVFNGRFYRYYYGDTEGHQYLLSQDLVAGSMTFQGVEYPDVMLNYDVFNDYVFVLWDQNGFIYYVLPDQVQVERFQIAGMDFIRLEENTIEGLGEGFYHQAYQGSQYQLLARKEKIRSKQNRTESTDKWYKFLPKNYYYIVSDGKAVPIKGKKDLISLSSDGTVANYIKQNKMKISPRRDDFLGNVVQVLGILEGN